MSKKWFIAFVMVLAMLLTLLAPGFVLADETFSSERIIVFYTDSNNWDGGGSINVHYWIDGASATTTWPGDAMTYLFDNGYGQSVYGATIPVNANRIIFNQGSETRTISENILNGAWWYGDGVYIEENTYHAAASATCTNAGNTAYYKLDDHYYNTSLVAIAADSWVIAALGHIQGTINYNEIKAPTCTETGTKQGSYTCSRCNQVVYLPEETVPALGHDMTKEVWDMPNNDYNTVTFHLECNRYECNYAGQSVAATVITESVTYCDSEGYYIQHLSATIGDKTYTRDDIDSQTQPLPQPIGHDWNTPTYEWTQENGVWKCTATRVCKRNENHVETETVTATSAVKTPATCTVMGTTTYTASFSAQYPAFSEQTKDVQDIAVNPNAHTWEFVDFTWNDFTAVANYKCVNDNSHETAANAGITSAVTKEATCEEKGVRTYTATVEAVNSHDGQKHTDTKTEDIPLAAHQLTEHPYVAATCTTDGNNPYWECTVCGKQFSDNTGSDSSIIVSGSYAILHSGHTEVVDAAVEPTDTSTGLTAGSHCSVCGAVIVAQTTIPTLEQQKYVVSALSWTTNEENVEIPVDPTGSGGLFCGYYTTLENGVYSGDTTKTDTAYAKFIDPNTLIVAVQIKEPANAGDPADIRFITTVPDKAYFDVVGFKLTMYYSDSGQRKTQVISNNAFNDHLYNQVYSNNVPVDVDGFFAQAPVNKSNDSVKLALQTVPNMDAGFFANSMKYYLEVIPFLKTNDGTTVYGAAKYFKGTTKTDGHLWFNTAATPQSLDNYQPLPNS